MRRKSLPRRAKRARFASEERLLYTDILPLDVVAIIVSFIVGPDRELERPKCKLPPKEKKAAAVPIAHKAHPDQAAPPPPQVVPAFMHAAAAAALGLPPPPPPPPVMYRPLKTGGKPEEALANMVEFVDTRNEALRAACAMSFVSIAETDMYSFRYPSNYPSKTEFDEGGLHLNTTGATLYKQLNTVCKSLGPSVHTLKFQNKNITKRYAHIMRRFCPNLKVLKLSWDCMFSMWRVSSRKMGGQMEELLAGIVPLDKLQVDISDCTQHHIDAIGKFAACIKHIVLNINSEPSRTSLGFKSLLPIYAGTNDGNNQSITQNLDISVREKFSDDGALQIQAIPIICPKVTVAVNGQVVKENAA